MTTFPVLSGATQSASTIWCGLRYWRCDHEERGKVTEKICGVENWRVSLFVRLNDEFHFIWNTTDGLTHTSSAWRLLSAIERDSFR